MPVAGGVLVVALAAATIAVLAKDDPMPGSPLPEPEIVGAGAVLDPRTADPCAVLDRESLTDLGTVLVDTQFGYFSQCGLSVRFNDEGDIATVGLFIEPLWDYLQGSYSPGTLGSIQHAKEDEDHRCERFIPLPDGNMVRINAENQGARLAEPCDMAQAVAESTHALLAKGPIPRRTEPFAEGSLGREDACDLLSDTELGLAIDRAYEVQPVLGRWVCYFAADGDDPQVMIEFSKEWKEPIDDPLPFGGRVGELDIEDGSCEVELHVLDYENASDANPTHQWTEIATVMMEDSSVAPESLCGKAKALAAAVEARLP
jgi:hypothetical protein